MTIYNPKSLKAEEFINDAEIRETLAYAEKNKGNAALIDEILEKARPRKTETGTVCRGLSHREASVLLACEIPEKVQEIYRLAEEIKLLCERMPVLSVSSQKQAHYPKKADTRGSCQRGYGTSGYGA